MNHHAGSPCPDPKCHGSLREDEYGIFCSLCGAETDTWAEPADADQPVRLDDSAPAPAVMLRPRRSKSRLPHFALAALALATTGVGAWLTLRPTPIEARATPLSSSELLAALREQRWPEGIALPAYYSEPELFFVKKQREAQSTLMNYWNAFTRDEKVAVLEELRRLHTPFALPLLAEVAWFALPQMTDDHLAGYVLAALLASSNEHIDTAIFVADFVAQAASNTTVAEYAENCRTHLVDRRQRLGR